MTLDTWKIGHSLEKGSALIATESAHDTNLSAAKVLASSTAVSNDLTKTGVFLKLNQPCRGGGFEFELSPAPRALEDFDDLLDSFCEDVIRCHVNLSGHNGKQAFD